MSFYVIWLVHCYYTMSSYHIDIPFYGTFGQLILYWSTWRSGYCDLNKGECNLSQSKDDSFVKRVAKNNNWNNGDCHKFMKFSWLFSFHYNSRLTKSTQFGNDSNYGKFNGKNIATNCSMVTVLALDGLTKKCFSHYALLKIFSVRSSSRTTFNSTVYSTDSSANCTVNSFTFM